MFGAEQARDRGIHPGMSEFLAQSLHHEVEGSSGCELQEIQDGSEEYGGEGETWGFERRADLGM